MCCWAGQRLVLHGARATTLAVALPAQGGGTGFKFLAGEPLAVSGAHEPCAWAPRLVSPRLATTARAAARHASGTLFRLEDETREGGGAGGGGGASTGAASSACNGRSTASRATCTYFARAASAPAACSACSAPRDEAKYHRPASQTARTEGQFMGGLTAQVRISESSNCKTWYEKRASLWH